MAATVDPIVFYLIIFVLAIFVGYHVVWSVTPALHTPLMSRHQRDLRRSSSSARCSPPDRPRSTGAAGSACVAVVLASINVVRRLPGHAADARDVQAQGAGREAGGEALSGDRCARARSPLRDDAPVARSARDERQPGRAVVPGRVGVLHPRAEGAVASVDGAPRQPARHRRHGDRGRRHAGARLLEHARTSA